MNKLRAGILLFCVLVLLITLATSEEISPNVLIEGGQTFIQKVEESIVFDTFNEDQIEEQRKLFKGDRGGQ